MLQALRSTVLFVPSPHLASQFRPTEFRTSALTALAPSYTVMRVMSTACSRSTKLLMCLAMSMSFVPILPSLTLTSLRSLHLPQLSQVLVMVLSLLCLSIKLLLLLKLGLSLQPRLLHLVSQASFLAHKVTRLSEFPTTTG